jgi:acyl-CoA dehydrogenase
VKPISLDETAQTRGFEGEQYVEACRRFAREGIEPRYRRHDVESTFPADIHEEAWRRGLLYPAIPREFGGAGVPIRVAAVGIEILASVCAPTTFSLMFNNAALRPILLGGSDEQKHVFVKELLERRECASICLTEEQGGSNLLALTTRAQPSGGRWRLHGTKVMVGNGTESRLFVVLADALQEDGKSLGPTFFAVPRSYAGVIVGENTDRISFRAVTTPSVTFDDVVVGGEHVIGPVGGALPILLPTLSFLRMATGPILLGIVSGALNDAFDWIRERRVHGGSLGSKSHVQIALGEIIARQMAIRSLGQHAASLAEQGQPYEQEASAVKLLAGELAVDATSLGVQLFGWRGVDSRFPIQKRFRDARQATIFEGTSEVQCLGLAQHYLRQRLRDGMDPGKHVANRE